MKIGYARVSTLEQNLDRQIDQLEREGCERIYSERLPELYFFTSLVNTSLL